MNKNLQYEQDKEILPRGNALRDGEVLESETAKIPVFTQHAQNPSQAIKRISDLLENRG